MLAAKNVIKETTRKAHGNKILLLADGNKINLPNKYFIILFNKSPKHPSNLYSKIFELKNYIDRFTGNFHVLGEFEVRILPYDKSLNKENGPFKHIRKNEHIIRLEKDIKKDEKGKPSERGNKMIIPPPLALVYRKGYLLHVISDSTKEEPFLEKLIKKIKKEINEVNVNNPW